jgi:hypothetical protein
MPPEKGTSMARIKMNDSVLLEKWLEMPAEKIKNRLILVLRNEILRLRAVEEESERLAADESSEP